jgi:ABC-2 type transport system permease protein
MKRFLGFVTKEFYHIFGTNARCSSWDIAQIMLFGFAITNEINNVNIAILDKSKDTETEINKISASQYFHIKQTISTESEIESIFKKRR